MLKCADVYYSEYHNEASPEKKIWIYKNYYKRKCASQTFLFCEITAFVHSCTVASCKQNHMFRFQPKSIAKKSFSNNRLLSNFPPKGNTNITILVHQSETLRRYFRSCSRFNIHYAVQFLNHWKQRFIIWEAILVN